MKTFAVRLLGASLAVVMACGFLAGCGDDDDGGAEGKRGLPLVRARLKNLQEGNGKKVKAKVVPRTKDGTQKPPLEVGPVGPGQDASKEDGVNVVSGVQVTVEAGDVVNGAWVTEQTFTAGGMWRRNSIKEVTVEFGPGEGGPGTRFMVVSFHEAGTPEQTIPLMEQQ